MQYTTLGRTGLKVSRLGFGGMRLPMKSGTELDRDLTIPMLRRAYELGVNLYDTAVGYCGGDSQRVIGEAFEGMRDKIVISTKNPHYDKADKAGWWKNLEDSLERLRTDYVDLYNHHGFSYDAYLASAAGEDGLYEDMLKAKEQGLIRHICFSFHAPNDQLMKLVDTGLYDTVILQYNLLYRELEEGIAHATESGMGVLVMGPIGGGRLGYPSERAASLVGQVKSTPELALRFVLSNGNVHVALSGMSTMQQLEENVETVASAGELTEEDHSKITAAIEERKKLSGLYCTGCDYCMPCPAGVAIPTNFEILNLERVYGLTEHARQRYAHLDGKAALCMACGKCVEKCPQNLDIPVRLADAVKALDERAGQVAGWCELRGASLEEGVLRLKLRHILKNVTDGTRSARVQFLPHGEDQVWPPELEFKDMAGYARKHKDIEVSVGCPGESYALDVAVTHDGQELIEHLGEIVAVAARKDSHSLDASSRRPGTVHMPSPLRTGLPKGRSLDFAVSYDDENLYVYADVSDDLSAPAKGGPEPHYLRIYLDGRTPYMIGHGAYEDGVVHVTLTPPAEGDGKIEAKASNEAEVKAVGQRTTSGYRMDCAVRWDSFVQVPAPPGVIGFDIGMMSCDAKTGEAQLVNWSGRPRGNRRPAAFGKLVTV